MKLVKAVLAVSLGAAIAASSMSAVQAKQITIGFLRSVLSQSGVQLTPMM